MTPLPKLAVFDLGEEQQGEFRTALPLPTPGVGKVSALPEVDPSPSFLSQITRSGLSGLIHT